MWVRTLLALLLCVVSFSLCSEVPLYHFVDKNLTWSEAQQFCRQHYHDLACVSSSEDNLRLPRPPGYSAPVWIGLYNDEWKWTATNSSGSYKNWFSNQDEQKYVHESQQCGYMVVTSQWRSAHVCSFKLEALCYSGSSPKVFHLSPGLMSWYDALTYCRTHYTDLALIENAEENTAASDVVYRTAWIGLFRSDGKWSDNRAVAFTAWYKPGLEETFYEPVCAAQNEHNTWEVFSCQERRPFYCQDEPKTFRFVEMKFSGHGLDGSAMMNQQILDEIQKRFEAAGRTDVKIKWKIAPEKQEEKNKKKKKKQSCPLNV